MLFSWSNSALFEHSSLPQSESILTEIKWCEIKPCCHVDFSRKYFDSYWQDNNKNYSSRNFAWGNHLYRRSQRRRGDQRSWVEWWRATRSVIPRDILNPITCLFFTRFDIFFSWISLINWWKKNLAHYVTIPHAFRSFWRCHTQSHSHWFRKWLCMTCN